MTFSWISTEREKQIVLRASRLMRVRRGRLLRSIRCVKILPVRCFSFGTSLTWLPRSSLVTMPIQNGVNRANSSRQVSSFLWLESVSQHTTSFSVVAPCCQRSSTAHCELGTYFTSKVARHFCSCTMLASYTDTKCKLACQPTGWKLQGATDCSIYTKYLK